MKFTFGEKLSELRKEQNLTQQQMADKLSIELRTYQNWEYNKIKKMDISKLNEIAHALGKDFNEINDFARMQYVETVTEQSVGIVNGNITLPELKTSDSNNKSIDHFIEIETLKNENSLLKLEIDFYRSILKDKFSNKP